MRRLLPFIIIIVALIASGCDRHVDNALATADALMDEHPDSALAILQSIAPESVGTGENGALYALLMTEGLEKNHITVTDDSLISIAADYYSRRDDKRRNMLAQYYLGRVHFNAGNYSGSLVAAIKSHEIAHALGDRFWIAMTMRGWSNVYKATFNTTEALQCAWVEYNNLSALGCQPYVILSMLDLAQAANDNGNHDMSAALSRQLLDSAYVREHKELEREVKANLGRALLAKGEYSKAMPYLESAGRSVDATVEDSAFLGVAYCNMGRVDKAREIADAMGDKDDVNTLMLRYELNKSEGALAEALEALRRYDSIKADEFSGRMSSNLTSSVIDYYKSRDRMVRGEVEAANLRMVIILIISLLVLGGLLYTFFYFYRRQKTKMDKTITIAENLKEILELRESECSAAQKSVRELINTRFDIFDDLFKAFYESRYSSASKKLISTEVAKLIDTLSASSPDIVQLEKHVNEYCNGIMADFRRDLPGLKEADYSLFLYSILGFSSTAISLFLREDKINSVYDRKKRLKTKIKQSESSRTDEYLRYLQ